MPEDREGQHGLTVGWDLLGCDKEGFLSSVPPAAGSSSEFPSEQKAMDHLSGIKLSTCITQNQLQGSRTYSTECRYASGLDFQIKISNLPSKIETKCL